MARVTEGQGSGRSGALIKLGALGALVIGVLLVLRFTPLGAVLSRQGIMDAIETLRGAPAAPVIFVALYAALTAFAVPGTVLTLAGGALFGFGFGTLFNWLGATLGAVLAFLLARTLGRDGVRKLLGDRLDTLDRATKDHGFQGILTLRLIPVVPFNVLNLGSGLTSVPLRSYAAATAVGILPGTAIYTFFADALLQGSTEASGQALTRMFLAGFLLVLLSLMPKILRRFGILPGSVAATLALALVPLSAHAQSPGSDLPNHQEFTALLADVVDYPSVDYAALVQERSRLDRYLDALGVVDPGALADTDHDTRLAFWINAYNACMLLRVVDRYPLEEAGSFLGRFKNRVAGRPANSVWQIQDVFTGDHCVIAGASRSQDEIEHEIIRPMGDPRIHFAVNCAAISCPPLPPHAFDAARLDEQLDARVQAFVTSEAHLRLTDGDPPTLRLGKVLEWYASDFGGVEGVRTFLLPYLTPDQREAVASPETGIEFMEYDWTLNDVAP